MTHIWYWRLVLFISFLAAIGCFFQSTRVTPLVDYSYQVENAYRIFKGELPYKDFFLVLSPGVYMGMALIMHLTGGYNHLVQLIFTMVLAGGVIVITAFVGRTFGNKFWFVFLLGPLLVSGHVLYPWPSYDMSAVFFIMIGIALLLSTINTRNASLFRWLLTGMVISIPSLFKQNIGIVFSCAVACIMVITGIRFPSHTVWKKTGIFLCGLILPFIIFYCYLLFSGSIEQFYTQTIVFPGIVRTPFQAIEIIKGEYVRYGTLLRQYSIFFITSMLSLSLPFGISLLSKHLHSNKIEQLTSYIQGISLILSSSILVGGFIYLWNILPPTELYITVVLLVWVTVYGSCFIIMLIRLLRAKTWKSFFIASLPVPLVLAAHAGYLSHHLVGSSYGLWPIFCFLLFWIIPKRISSQVIFFIILSSFLLTIVLFRSMILYDFFAYVHLDGEKHASTYSRIHGLTVSGPWIPDMERLFRYVEKNIPQNQLIAFLPGEDPFYAVTGRENPLPFVQLHTQTYPVYASDIIELIYQYDVQWLILKTRWQLFPYFGMVDLTTPSFGVDRYFTLVDQLPSYNIYRLNSHE